MSVDQKYIYVCALLLFIRSNKNNVKINKICSLIENITIHNI